MTNDLAENNQKPVVWLDELLAAISSAVTTAHKGLAHQHHDMINQDWTLESPREVINNEKPVPRYHSQIIELTVASGDPDAAAPRTIKVPLAALSHHQTTRLDKVTIDIECAVADFTPSGRNNIGRIAVRLDKATTDSASMKISATFGNEEMSEGLGRLNNIIGSIIK